MFWPVNLGLNIKYWSSPDLNSMRWLGLFKKTFRKHLKLIFPHRDLYIICIVSLAIFHPHFVIRIFPSAFYHPHFSTSFYHPHFSIRHPPSAAIRSSLYRDPRYLVTFCFDWSDMTSSRNFFPPAGALIILWWIHALSKIIFLVTTSALGGINNRGNFVIKAYDNIKGKWFRSNVVFK